MQIGKKETLCGKAVELREAWYATAPVLDWNDPGAINKCMLAHLERAYQRSYQTYISHRRTCPTCRSLMAAMTPAPVERGRPKIKTFEEVVGV